MIVVKLSGGLGNQMFQYAAGKSLSSKLGVSLGLDIRELVKGNTTNEYTFRTFQLNKFLINSEIVPSNPSIFKLFIFRCIKKFKKYNELSYSFDNSFFSLKGNIHLIGYWQSEQYFNNIREELLLDFKLRHSLDKLNKRLEEKIHNSNSVAVHIRRGDYISNSSAAHVHGICSIEYYLNAISYLSNFFDNLKLFVFSDDIAWAKNNLKELNYEIEYVEGNIGDDSYIDLYLMSQCNHNIIANSTFSWWSAWLNQNKGKTVIAPKKWFNSNELKCDDLIPSNWVRL
jgi:hypothetical protein